MKFMLTRGPVTGDRRFIFLITGEETKNMRPLLSWEQRAMDYLCREDATVEEQLQGVQILLRAVADGAEAKVADCPKPKKCNRQRCEWPHCRDHVGVCAFTVNRRATD